MSAEITLPKEWINSKLEQLTQDISYGYTAKSTTENVGPHLLRITDIQDNNVNWATVPYCEIESKKKDQYLLKKGDLVFARTGATVGKSYLIKADIPDAVYASYLIKVRAISDNTIKYLSLFFKSPYYWSQITEFSAGIGQPNVNGSKLKDLIIPFAPLAEQHQVAQRLDELLAQVDTIKARLDAITPILKRFRQSVLSAAVSGKLTEEWRGNANYTDIDGYKISVDWSIQALKDICSKVQSGSTPKNNPFEQGGNIPYLKVYNIVEQKINFEYKPQFVTSDVHNSSLKRSIVIPYDILMNIVGPPLGKVAITPDTYKEWNINQAITLFRANEEILDYKYLYYVLCEGKLVRDIMPETKGSVGQINISLSQCREFKIPVPNIKEQIEIVRRVDQLFTFADQTEQRVNDAKARVDKLTQSILAKAFRGELTADWRAEHPELISGENSAEALLAKIQAAKAALDGKKKKGKAA